MKRWSLNKTAVAALAALGLSAAMADYASNSTAGPSPLPGTDAPPTKVISPAKANLPQVAAEVLRMSEAGISDGVITSYIQSSANTYNLDADQIVYLRDVGVSSTVLNALVAHGQAAADGQAETSSGATAAQNGSSQTPPPVSGAADNFYDALTPYGTWVDVPDYGWCWQPTVVAVNPAWQPYCNDGSWLWTDNGWYWNSYYAWGWAPFHYGRWCQYPHYGWLWCPDNIWGPAWVCWRDYPGYCGWAPLPPGACFAAGLGWTFNGIGVGFDFGFGLGPGCFTFCDFDDFCGRHPFGHFRHGRDADRFFRDSRVNNNFAVDAHHGFINRGIDPSRIEAATHRPIQQVAVRDLPRGAGRSGDFTMPDRLTRNGNSAVIYRPDRNISVPRNPFLPGHEPQSAGWRGGFTDRSVAGNAARFPSARLNGPPNSTVRGAWNDLHGGEVMRRWGGVENSQMTRSQPAPGYGQNSYAWHSAPVWHAAPSYAGRSAPSGSAPHFSSPAPSVGQTRSWGGGGNSGGGAMHFNGGGANIGGGGMHFSGGG
ncbi:MAG TPA: DUF6600 domain-containing protein, partial [Verrucomicrobiae bacterium]|nr:DUF6600 domain-containing protein [Verrucomicrobiae bacterium]